MAQTGSQRCSCGCGAEVVQPAQGRRRRFASAACRQAAYRARGWARELDLLDTPGGGSIALAEAERLAGRRRGRRSQR